MGLVIDHNHRYTEEERSYLLGRGRGYLIPANERRFGTNENPREPEAHELAVRRFLVQCGIMTLAVLQIVKMESRSNMPVLVTLPVPAIFPRSGIVSMSRKALFHTAMMTVMLTLTMT